MRVGGKVVGQPGFLGLEQNAELPARLLGYVVGEVIADSLEEDVTADWGAIIENSVAYTHQAAIVISLPRKPLSWLYLAGRTRLKKGKLRRHRSQRSRVPRIREPMLRVGANSKPAFRR